MSRDAGDSLPLEEGPPNICERAGRLFSRDCVGIVNRRAMEFEEGVEGLAGGVLVSYMRLVELLWLFAFDAAVGSS